MTYDDELIDDLYKEMTKDKELMEVLKKPKTAKEKNLRIRRELTPLSEATAENVPFLSMYLSSCTETDNVYVTRAFLTVDFYAGSIAELKKLKKAVRNIFEPKGLLSESQHSVASDTKGVYRYRIIYRPLIWA